MTIFKEHSNTILELFEISKDSRNVTDMNFLEGFDYLFAKMEYSTDKLLKRKIQIFD